MIIKLIVHTNSTDKMMELWRMLSILEKIRFAEISTLILKIGQTRKQFQEMGNTIFFL